MQYSLAQLAPGSYDLLLDGEPIASIVQDIHRRGPALWIVELIEELPRSKLPAPFRHMEHHFESLGHAKEWLGISAPGAEGQDWDLSPEAKTLDS